MSEEEGSETAPEPQEVERWSSGLTLYLRSRQALWFWAMLIIAVTTVIAIFVIPEGLYPWVYVRYALGSVYVLWLPGYAFVKALFPSKVKGTSRDNGLDWMEQSAISIGMSLAFVSIIGLLLNYTPWGITIVPVTLSLLAFTLVFSTAALIRE